MQTSKSERYLGDILSSDSKRDDYIKDRYSKGISYINQIMSIMKEITFGQYFFEQAILLRNSKLVNGILCSIEAVHGLTLKHIERLELCDRFLMRKLFNSRWNTNRMFLH